MPSISSRYMQSFVDGCTHAGVPREVLLSRLPDTARPLDHPGHHLPGHHLPGEALLDLLEEASALSGRSDIGLFCGQRLRPDSFLDIGYGVVASATLREALEFNIRYQRLTQTLGTMALIVDGQGARITWAPAIGDDERMRPVVEAVFAGYAVIGRWLTWENEQRMAGMDFRHGRPPHHEAVERLFDCAIHYHAPCNAMHIDPGLLDRPLPQANPELIPLLRQRLDRALAALDRPAGLSVQVADCLQALMPQGAATLERTAACLGFSPRTLRRRLAQEGTSFREVLETARKEACAIHLRQGRINLAELAQWLGYSEQSAFTRAFRGWHGCSPAQWLNGN